MSVTSNRSIIITFSDDYVGDLHFDADENVASPGSITIHDLVIGDNTITIPLLASGATIVPPVANVEVITLKGVGGDTGIVISPTEPTSIGFAATPAASFILNAAGAVTSLRVVWT